jgi:hypothetical protein
MQFMTIYRTKEKNSPPTQDEMARMGAFIEEYAKAGVLIATGGLMPSAAGAKVRLADGKISVTDGPFAEAKEVIGGFAITEHKSKEEAIEMCERFLKVAGDGESEVRELSGVSFFRT